MSLKPFQLFEIPFYHKLAKLIYGSNFHQLQGELINNLKGKNILVIGPGNGDFLQYLDTKIKYTFIEKSKTFSLQLQKKIDESIGINSELIFGDFLKINIQKKFDAVVCPFFLDLLNPTEMKLVSEKFEYLLNPIGQILILDFKKPETFIEKIHMKFLYFIFRRTDGISGNEILEFESQNFKELKRMVYKKSWFYKLEAKVYARNTSKA
jgi:ubiquinone/menaquinone biosynthesis C-methylase UbiE